MNLAEMAAQICQDTGYLDTDDLAYAKLSLRQRDDLIYRMGLWKDSLVQVTLTVNPTTNEDHAEGIIYLPEVIERVIAVRTADQPVNVNGLETFYRIPFDKFSQTGSPFDFAKLNPGWFTYRPQSPDTGLWIEPQNESDNNSNVRATWRGADGVQHVDTVRVTAGGPRVEMISSKIEVISVFKQITVSTMRVMTDSTYAEPYSMANTDTASPRYQRIRIFPIPVAAGGIKVLGKAKYVPLDFDQAEPQITGSHLCLMAFAKAMLRKRGGEHGASNDDLTEAMGMLEVLKKEEMQQEAHNQRILPESGYGDAFFGPGRDGFFVG